MIEYYAGIGSRKTPGDVLEVMERFAYLNYHDGIVLRSGGADGADSAFEDGHDRAAGFGTAQKDIYLAQHAKRVDWAQATVDQFHPAPHRLGSYARNLMARNAMQLFGRNGQEPVKYVICWTPNASASGGTGQAIRMAHHHNIPVCDLGNDGKLREVTEWVEEERQRRFGWSTTWTFLRGATA